MTPLSTDREFIHAAVEELESYLLSGELYWELGGTGRLLSLTPGNLLLSLRKLDTFPWAPGIRETMDTLIQQVEGKRRQWRTAWLHKANREIQARLRLWQEYLQETSAEGGKLVDYSFQVRWRTILDLLCDDGAEMPVQVQNQLDSLDERLKSLTVPAPFIWEAEIAPGFKADEFWYLYRAQRRG